MTTETIHLIKVCRRPFGRLERDYGERSGEYFRKKHLVPSLKNNQKVHIVLDGYNRYGRSFIDEAFGGLVRYEGFTTRELEEKLSYSHSLVKSIELLIKERIDEAGKEGASQSSHLRDGEASSQRMRIRS